MHYVYKYKHDSFFREISKKPAITTGYITKVQYKSKLGYVVSYYYEVNNQDVNEETYRSNVYDLENSLVGKSFPVIYSTVNPEYHGILIFPDDFKAYNIRFPDSLYWIAKHIKN